MKQTFIKFINYIGKLFLLALGLNAGFFVLLTLVWLIPESFITPHLQASMDIIGYEGRDWTTTFTYTMGSCLDNVTDATMLEATVSYPEIKTPVQKAMSINNYTRYWHGYLVFLRPLMALFSYYQIRYLYMFLFLLLFCFLNISIYKRLGKLTAILFSLSLGSTYFMILPYSLQYSSVYFIMLAAVLYILSRYGSFWKREHLIYFFFIIGAVTNFTDLLTAPLLTLGIPLLFIMLVTIKELPDASLWKNLSSLAYGSIAWVAGYSITWISKWFLAAFFLHDNSIERALKQASLRINGTDEFPVSRGQAIAMNIETFLPPGFDEIPYIRIILLFLLLVFAVIFLFKRKDIWHIVNYIPLLLLAAYPYIWYFILANHSSDHPLFTYRIQMITLFALLSAYFGSIRLAGHSAKTPSPTAEA